jgi:hypothetical protein
MGANSISQRACGPTQESRLEAPVETVRKNAAPGSSFTPIVLVLNEVVLVLLLDLVRETPGSSTSTGETPEYE